MSARPSDSAPRKDALVRAARMRFEADVMRASGHGTLSARLGGEKPLPPGALERERARVAPFGSLV